MNAADMWSAHRRKVVRPVTFWNVYWGCVAIVAMFSGFLYSVFNWLGIGYGP